MTYFEWSNTEQLYNRLSKMEQIHIQRLRAEQQKAIDDTKDRIQTLQNFRDDYTNLKTRLGTLADKVTHNVMVPFGKKAFMPGQLVHTNEILVLLGDNWFVEKSAKGASEVVDRRLKVLDKQIQEFEQQLGLLTPRLGFTSELQHMAEQKGDIQEITEEYDPEKEKQWRERHRENVRHYNKQQREEHRRQVEEFDARQAAMIETAKATLGDFQQDSTPATSKVVNIPSAFTNQASSRQTTPKPEVGSGRRHTDLVTGGNTHAQPSDEELWARLERLELEEEEAGELDSFTGSRTPGDGSSSEEESDDEGDEKVVRRKVQWQDQPSLKRISNVIRFKHSETSSVAPSTESDDSLQSPRDIFEKFGGNVPKSILKASTGVSPMEVTSRGSSEDSLRNRLSGIVDRVQQKDVPGSLENAFTAEVVEKAVSDVTNAAQALESAGNQERTTRKVSKFKAKRLQNRPTT